MQTLLSLTPTQGRYLADERAVVLQRSIVKVRASLELAAAASYQHEAPWLLRTGMAGPNAHRRARRVAKDQQRRKSGTHETRSAPVLGALGCPVSHRMVVPEPRSAADGAPLSTRTKQVARPTQLISQYR